MLQLVRSILCYEVDKPSKILIKISNVIEYIKSDIQNLRCQEQMILSSSMYEKPYLQGFLEGVLEAIQVFSLYWYPHNLWMVGSPPQSSSREKKEEMREFSQGLHGHSHNLFIVILV